MRRRTTTGFDDIADIQTVKPIAAKQTLAQSADFRIGAFDDKLAVGYVAGYREYVLIDSQWLAGVIFVIVFDRCLSDCCPSFGNLIARSNSDFRTVGQLLRQVNGDARRPIFVLPTSFSVAALT